MFRLFISCVASGLLLACASQTPVATDSAPAEPLPDIVAAEVEAPERAFPEDSIYPLLLAEFALRRQAYDVALEQYLEQAPKLRDAGVSEHATHLAQFMSQEQAALAAVQLWGGAGVVSGNVVESLYREIRSLRIYEGATEVQQLIIGKDLLKET